MTTPKFIKGMPYTEEEIMGILGPENTNNRKYLHDIQKVPNYNGEVIIPTHSNSEGSYTNSQRRNSQSRSNSQSRINSEGSFNNTISNRENSNIVSNTTSKSKNIKEKNRKSKAKGKGKGNRNKKSRRKGKHTQNQKTRCQMKKNKRKEDKKKTQKRNAQIRRKKKEIIFNSNQQTKS